jgi:hypothetical protein
MTYNMAAHAVADDRPAKVVYFSDFDLSGWQVVLGLS